MVVSETKADAQQTPPTGKAASVLHTLDQLIRCHQPPCPTHDEAKKGTIWFTDKARVNCSIGFDDFMIVVTL
jgi:hypothetical protein